MEQKSMNIQKLLRESTPVTPPSGNPVFNQGIIFRRVSRFITGGDEDSLMPIPVYYDYKTGEVFLESLPKEIREEFKKYNESLLNEKVEG